MVICQNDKSGWLLTNGQAILDRPATELQLKCDWRAHNELAGRKNYLNWPKSGKKKVDTCPNKNCKLNKFQVDFVFVTLQIAILQFLYKIWTPDTYFLNGRDSYLHKIAVPNRWDSILQIMINLESNLKNFLRL